MHPSIFLSRHYFQVEEADLAVIFPIHRQCMYRDLFFRFEMAELVEADTLPGPDDYGSHAALLLSTFSAATFNVFNFLPNGARAVEALGKAAPVDVEGMRFFAAVGNVQEQLDAHPRLALEIGTNYTFHNQPLNATMKAAVMKAYNVAPRAQAGPSRLSTDAIPACLKRTRVLAVLSGLRDSRPQDSALLRSVRSISNMLVEDVLDGSVQVWFVLRAEEKTSVLQSRPVDIRSTLAALQAAADRLSRAAGDNGGAVRLTVLDARERGRFRLPLSKLRVHRWTYKAVLPSSLRQKLQQLEQQGSVVAPARRSAETDEALPAGRGSGVKAAACQWSPPGTVVQLNGESRRLSSLSRPCFFYHVFRQELRLMPRLFHSSPPGSANLAVMELRWMQASLALSQGWETLVLPTAGARVVVRCRDPLSGGHDSQTYKANAGELLFVPASLSCVGSISGGRALKLSVKGAVERPTAWEEQSPRAPYLDRPSVVRPWAGGGGDGGGSSVLFNATRHFRLLDIKSVSLAAGETLGAGDDVDSIAAVFEVGGQLVPSGSGLPLLRVVWLTL